jgi:ATP-dependent Clp protease protease subunit
MIQDERVDLRSQDNDEEKPDENQQANEYLIQRMLRTRTLLLSGEVNKSLAERAVRQLLLLEQAGDEPIYVFIDSPGGDADAGFAIFDMIRFIKPDVYTVGMGLVASAAALVLLASPAEHRIALPNSHYLIHQPLSGTRGVATDIEIHAREIEKMRGRINKIIADETGKPLEQVEKDTDRDFWMGADEAHQYGLVSRIIQSRAELGE